MSMETKEVIYVGRFELFNKVYAHSILNVDALRVINRSFDLVYRSSNIPQAVGRNCHYAE